MLEDAIATKAYDAVILHPLDPGGIASTVEKAEAAGIPVYNWVTPVKTDQDDRLRRLQGRYDGRERTDRCEVP